MVSHYSRWLKDRDDRGRCKETLILAAFDAERLNVEAAPRRRRRPVPALVVAGCNPLRHRVDHGTRRSLLHKALKILDGALPAPVLSPTAPSPPPSRTPSDEVQAPLLPLLLIELGYVHNNASQYKEGTIAYAAALRHAVGRPVPARSRRLGSATCPTSTRWRSPPTAFRSSAAPSRRRPR